MILEVFFSLDYSGKEVRPQRASWRVGFRGVLLPFASQPAASTASCSFPGEICGWSLFWEPGVWVMTAAGNYSGGMGNSTPALTKTLWPEQRPRHPPAASAQPLFLWRIPEGIKKEAAHLISFLGRAKTNSVKPDTWQGKKSLSKASPPLEKAGIVDISLWVPAADLGDPEQEPN